MAAHAAQTRANLQLLSAVRRQEPIRAALNEASPERGLAAGHFGRILRETAGVDTAMLLEMGSRALVKRLKTAGITCTFVDAPKSKARLHTCSKAGARVQVDETVSAEKAIAKDKLLTVVAQTLDAAAAAETLFDKRGSAVLADALMTEAAGALDEVVSPLVTDIALWLGDTGLRKHGKGLITQAQLDELAPKLQPGDLIVARRNWYLSNLGLPGFWPHAELWVGAQADLTALGQNPGVKNAYKNGWAA